MSLLTICQGVARDIGINVPTTIIDNTDESAVRLLAQARRSLAHLVRRHNWTALQKEHKFTLVNADADYTLASDFDYFLYRTHYDQNKKWELGGPVSPQGWQQLKSGVITNGLRRQYRVKLLTTTRQLFIDPTPVTADSGVTIVYEYSTSKPVLDNDGSTLKADWAEDADAPLIESHLIEFDMVWRMLKRLGLPYFEEKLEAEMEIAQSISRDGGSKPLSIDGAAALTIPGIGIPETDFNL